MNNIIMIRSLPVDTFTRLFNGIEDLYQVYMEDDGSLPELLALRDSVRKWVIDCNMEILYESSYGRSCNKIKDVNILDLTEYDFDTALSPDVLKFSNLDDFLLFKLAWL